MIPNNIQALFVMAVIVMAFLLIYRRLLRPPITFLLANLLFLVSGILQPGDLLAGLANESIVSIILLILLTAGLRKNFRMEMLLDRIYGSVTSYRGFLGLMMTKVALISAIMNNTPVVAAMSPYVFNWGRKNKVNPSKLLIPLSYATICGGMITLIGTSTTLVLNGFLIERGLNTIPVLKLLVIGLAVTVAVILFMVVFGHFLLPDRKEALDEFENEQRQYLLEAKLDPQSLIAGKTVKEAELRHLKGLYLVEIIRENEIISPVDPTEQLQGDDTLIFAGNTSDILDLVTSGKGLNLPHSGTSIRKDHIHLVEVVVSSDSNLIGKKVQDSDFRNRYQAAIAAIHRNGEFLRGKIGEIRIHQGDLLLLLAGKRFKRNLELYRDLYVISELEPLIRPSKQKAWSLALVALTALVLLMIGHFSLFTSLLIVIAVMAGLKMIDMQDIKREIDFNLVAILVFSLALGMAVINTGAGDLMAQAIIDLFSIWGPPGVMAALLVITTLLTSFISNVGAVSVTFPIAMSLANSYQIDGSPFYLALAFAASAAFLTPMGYQTNLIVYGPGGYTYGDFFKAGLPVTIIYLTSVFLLLKWLYPELWY